VLMGNLVACRDAVIWAIDLKKGMELKPWQSCIARLATTPEQAIALLRDAVAVLEARAEFLAAAGKRAWPVSPDMPSLVIIIDEYAELADGAPDSMHDTDSIARLGRAVAVTLIAATQRPTQKAMGQGAVRSQMDLRICFRVRERKDVDLILGQGMLRTGWDAHNLNAPGKFLISAPEHDTPKRARAYLLTDQAVAETATRYATDRPGLDAESQLAILAANEHGESMANSPVEDIQIPEVSHSVGDRPGPSRADEELWLALCFAPDEGTDVGELLRLTEMSRPTLYRRLAEHARAGRAIQVNRGRWRAVTTEEPPR
jgi:DNA segregation ATPase FtsK/SpoIIIE-like protein